MIKNSGSSENILMAGAAKTDITPPLGTIINGDFIPHRAHTIHDRLYARALVIQSGDTGIAIVVVDICMMPKDFDNEVKEIISKSTGLRIKNISISATHTHAAGSVDEVYLSPSDESYSKFLSSRIVDAVLIAFTKIQPAETGFSRLSVPDHVRCRRYKMHPAYIPLNPITEQAEKVKTNPFGLGHLIAGSIAIPDPEVCFLAVRSTGGKWISILANYSLHYVGDWQNGTITADYFGVFCKRLEDAIANDSNYFVPMMSNGTSGDINIWDFDGSGNYPTEQFSKSELIGTHIANELLSSLPGIEWSRDPLVMSAHEELTLKIRKPSAAEAEKAATRMAEADLEKLVPDENGLRTIYAREQLMLQEFPETLAFAVQSFRIGNTVIGMLAGEIFAETGLWLKKMSPVKNYFTISLANGNQGYLPPAHEIEDGGYETWRSRTSKLDAEQEVKNTLLRQVTSLHKL